MRMKASPSGYRPVFWKLQLFVFVHDSVLRCDKTTVVITTLRSYLPQLVTLDHTTSYDLAHSFTL